MLKSEEFTSKIKISRGRDPRAAIYVRTTTKGSRRQIRKELKCRAYCEERNWTIVEDLVISEVASPSTLDRKGLQKILEAAASHSFDILIIYEFGELSKNYAQSQYIIDNLAKHSIFIAIVNDLTLEQMLEKIERYPDDLKHSVKSEIANLFLNAANRQN